MTPEFDVCVIGGGPAGLAAAVRARWLKRHHAVCCKVVIIDPAPLGGLAAMGSTVLTGLHFQMTSEQILEKLLGDVRELNLPHIEQGVLNLAVDSDGCVHLELASGRVVTCWSAIIACGMRMLGREADYWGRGVTGLSMGIDHVVKTLNRLATDGGYRRIAFVGSLDVLRLKPILEAARCDDRVFDFIVEPTAGIPQDSGLQGAVVGTIVGLEGAPQLNCIRIHLADDNVIALAPVDLLVMDFLSLEARPARSFRAAGLAVEESGFIRVDRRCHTNLPGVFASGDATGMPACVAKAFGEGVVAGFEAYRHVFNRKFGTEPQLFAYYPWQGDLGTFPGELPQMTGNGLRLELIGSREQLETWFKNEGTSELLVQQILGDKPRAVEALAQAAGVPLELATSVVRSLLIHKLATLR